MHTFCTEIPAYSQPRVSSILPTSAIVTWNDYVIIEFPSHGLDEPHTADTHRECSNLFLLDGFQAGLCTSSAMEDNITGLIGKCSLAFRDVTSGMGNLDRDARSDIEEAFGKYKLWCYEVGIVRTDSSALEHRLRDSSHIRQLVAELLDDLRRTLLELKTEFNDDNATAENQEDHDLAMNQLVRCTKGIMTRLMETAILFERPAPHDRILVEGASGGSSDEVKGNLFDMVIDLFPNASVSSRNWLRIAAQARLCYLARRRRPLDPIHETIGYRDYQGSVLEEAGLLDEDRALRLQELGYRYMPPLEYDIRHSWMGPWLCPYCRSHIQSREESNLRQHVLQDLCPYVCVYPTCNTPRRSWDQRAEWYDHYRRHHRTEPHHETPRTGSIDPDKLESIVCELCQKEMPEVRMEEHLGQHLEEFAVVASCYLEYTPTTLHKQHRVVPSPDWSDTHLGMSISKNRFIHCCLCGDGPYLVVNYGGCPTCGHGSCPHCRIVAR